MKRLYVPTGCRGGCLGRSLVVEVVRRATNPGYTRMVLDTLPEMADAARLCRSLGFVEADRHRDNLVEETVCMEKPLTESKS